MEKAELNLFRQAKQLLDKKDKGAQLAEEEQGLVNSAEAFAINLLPKLEPEYDNLPVLENLEELARMVEEAMVAGSRGRAVVARQGHNLKVVGSNPTPATREGDGS